MRLIGNVSNIDEYFNSCEFDHSHICFIGKLSCLKVSYGVFLSFNETDAMVFGTTCLFLVISVFVHSWKRPANGKFVYFVLYIECNRIYLYNKFPKV